MRTPREPVQRKISVWAFTVPLAFVLASAAWAVSAYFMQRENQRAQVELARIERMGR